MQEKSKYTEVLIMLKKFNEITNRDFDFTTPLTMRESNILFFAILIVIGVLIFALVSIEPPML